MSEDVDKALGLRPLPVVYEPKEIVPVETENQVDEDVDQAREGLYDALAKSQEAVDDMLMIARSSQHPKAYEVLNSVIKTMADVSMGLADLQLKKQRLKKGETNETQDGHTTTNNLFVGSTAELQQMLEKMKNGS